MAIENSVLYEQFVDARCLAVDLTDRYQEAPIDDPRRAEMWDHVVRQTETARQLLESWLQAGAIADRLPETIRV